MRQRIIGATGEHVMTDWSSSSTAAHKPSSKRLRIRRTPIQC